MSEVYIRSQNKEKLYRLGGNYACVEYGEYEDVKKKRGSGSRQRKPAAGISLSRKPTGLQCWQLPCWQYGRQRAT